MSDLERNDEERQLPEHYEMADALTIRIIKDKIRERKGLHQAEPIDPEYLRLQLHLEGFKLPDDDPGCYPS